MKICKLKLKNLNSFRDEIDLDFEKSPLGDASLVAITGPTGAGKTTLLDAVCVALYGKTPRLTGQGSQNPNHLISHGEKEGFAEVIFIANGIRYLGTWSAKQKGSPKVALFYADDDKLITDKLSTRGKSLGSSEKTVSEEVEAILGLDFDAFRRSVMLAQGEFAAFLKASDEERRTILEATAGIGIYDELKKALNDKVGAVEVATADVLDKLKKIPEASREQLSEAQTLCDKLQSEAKALGTQSRHIQDEKQREEGRTADFVRLQSSKDRQDQLTDQQPEIDALQTTLENANRADRLRPEKQKYDTAKSDLENAEKALDTATEEKTETETHVKTDQTVYDEKEEAYQTTSQEHTRKIPLYRNAKLDVARAANQFAEAHKRTTALTDLDKQIDEVSHQLTERQTERTELQKQITIAQTFLDENPLPLDRQQRLTRATGFLAQLDSQTDQLETASTSKAQHEKKVSSLRRDIEKLSKTREEQLTEKVNARKALENASAELEALLATGTSQEWTERKQQTVRVQPIVQRGKEAIEDLENLLAHLEKLNETSSTLNAELALVKAELREQTKACQRAAAAVQHCEEYLRSALLADSAYQLRHQLHEGESCPVCGATEHPYANAVESESEERLQNAEIALKHAKAEAQATEAHRQALQTKQVQTEQDIRNIVSQLPEGEEIVDGLRDKMMALWKQSLEIHLLDGKISIEGGMISGDSEDSKILEFVTELEGFQGDSDRPFRIGKKFSNFLLYLIVEQISAADTAIAALREAEQAQTKALHAYEIVSQQLETCENNIKRETNDLNDIETQLEDLIRTIADLQTDIAATETRFWESMPDSFHGIAPAAAVKQFDDRIGEVGKHEGERDSAKTQLQVLNATIEADQTNLKGLKERHETLNAEIEAYRHEGKTYLNTVREETGGLESEAEINATIDKLEGALQAKVEARDDAEQQLLGSRELLTQKQTTHGHCEEQYEEFSEKLETARDSYFNKLSDAGFDSPEAHNTAFRNDEQLQELTDQIDVYESEKQGLELVITELRTRFEETPFDPEALGRIETQVEEIGKQLQTAQQEVGAQQQKIDDLKDALAKREALGVEISEAEQELKRWKRLQDTIPRNDLRDFALEIMFKQMGNLANEQLKYLTSERYQLKVEGIGDLTVIDRWNANEERPVETLSGGESFLTSLALALALSELSRGRAQLNSLFLDEGFGTLDTETLDIAIAALEGLRMQGRSIFLISHIQELTRRLPVKINVRKRGNGSSYIGN